MKTNIFQKFGRILLIMVMLFCCIALSACGMDQFDEPDPDGGVNVAGVKVLRKPLNGYDFEGNVTDKEGHISPIGGNKDFYYSLASDIIRELFYVYGNFNTNPQAESENKNVFEFYDSKIQLTKMRDLSTQFKADPDKFVYFYDAIRMPITEVAQSESEEGISYKVSASSSYAWKWTIPINSSAFLPLVERERLDTEDNIFSPDSEIPFSYEGFNRYYSNSSGEYLFNTTTFSASFNNEDYITTLAYAIYSSVLRLNLAEHPISVSVASGQPVVSISGYPAVSGKTSAQVALAAVKDKFNSLGTYVGLSERNKNDIINFVKTEIIGSSAIGHGKTSLYDLCYDDVVEAIVRYSGTETTTGVASQETGDGSTTVGDQFMASEVVDYPSTSFFSSLDDDPFSFIRRPYEYQSFVLMPSVDKLTFDELWLDFKYDAGRDGDLVTTNTYLDIEVILRWKKEDGTVRTVSKTIRVMDGPADVGEDGTTLTFDLGSSDEGFGEAVEIGRFHEPEVLKGKREDDYIVTLTGFTDARRYYEVMEGASYNGYGVLRADKIEGSYFEVAFNVNKTPGDDQTNYAFYCAISNLFEPPTYDDDPDWQ